MTRILLCLTAVATIWARDPETAISRYAPSDFELRADPAAPQWKDARRGDSPEKGPRGEAAPGHRTEIRSRWTDEQSLFPVHLPLRSSCILKPNPVTNAETNQLWDWDVAEVFIGSDFQHITRYKEFEVSPQGEWVDLDIDRDHPLPEGGWLWNSGFTVKARIDADKKIWYGEMRIPLRLSTSAGRRRV